MKLNTRVLSNDFGNMIGSRVKLTMASFFCIVLLVAGCSKGPIEDYQILETLVKERCRESPAEQLDFPCFALVAPEEKIEAKILELWRRGKDNMAKELVLRQIKIKDSLFVRKLNTGKGEFFPVLSVEEAKQLSGNVQFAPISGWNLRLMDCVGSGVAATVSVQLVDNPYLVLCEREFRLMRELCQHLGAKSVEITDSEKRYEEVKNHGKVELQIKAQQFGGVGNAEYEKTYRQYTEFFANTFAEFNSGKGASRIKRGYEDYSPGLKARLEGGDPDFCDLERQRKTIQNQTTHWAWKYSYEEKGDKNLMARLEIGCKILGVPIGGVVSPSWQKTAEWERQKKWYLIATFPESEVID